MEVDNKCNLLLQNKTNELKLKTELAKPLTKLISTFLVKQEDPPDSLASFSGGILTCEASHDYSDKQHDSCTGSSSK